ncbi:asparagine synthase-related protein [Saccharothrix longispora]|uniref:asparagine synthase (glutamine-hydrolyzing) n=1 Tax=Saccharothrix longispora TaxID=33920 RepID=A0ABU1PQM6_9PSEU|nr:asparagine synthase-related protein [Saccharothrix longispora]MDR6592957.1 asparagine synthase (glutamine-hydrolyzing) [Saccharothrix longispora]
MVTCRAGVVVLIGFCPLDDVRLDESFGRLTDVRQVDRVRLPGSHHVIAAFGPTTRARGTASNTRRLFRGADAVANRADVVAAAANAPLDEESAALRLLFPIVPHPLTSTTLWRGVTAVPPGDAVEWGRDGAPTTSTWWTAPDADLTLEEAAGPFREALTRTIRDSAAAHPTISADLSGGMDSTPIAYLAWQRNEDLTAYTMTGLTTEDDDTAVALSAADRMPGVRHALLDTRDLPLPFEALFDPRPYHDEPFLGPSGARVKHIARLAAAHGSTLHFTGHGGDEVLGSPASYLHRLVRRSPLVALDHIRGHRGLRRWSVRQVWQAVADNRSYPRWLADSAAGVGPAGPPTGARLPPPSWHHRLWLAPWTTPAGRHSVVRALTTAAHEARSLSPDRSQHMALEGIRAAGRVSRLLGHLTGDEGVGIAVPFLDDRVVEVALSVRPHLRAGPWAFKPLLTTAFRGVVPDSLIRRSTKNDMAEDVHAGLRAQRHRLADWCDDLVLGSLGLVDAAALRRASLSPQPPGRLLPVLAMTFNLESWLRTTGRDRSRAVPSARGDDR